MCHIRDCGLHVRNIREQHCIPLEACISKHLLFSKLQKKRSSNKKVMSLPVMLLPLFDKGEKEPFKLLKYYECNIRQFVN